MADIDNEAVWVLSNRRTKRPRSAKTGNAEGWNQPEAWSSREEVEAEITRARDPDLRLGIVVTSTVRDVYTLWAVDIDKAVDPAGGIADWAQPVLDLLHSAPCERSISGRGFHLYFVVHVDEIPAGAAQWPTGFKQGDHGFELYGAGGARHFLYTGASGPLRVLSGDELRTLYMMLANFAQPAGGAQKSPPPPNGHDYASSDDVVMSWLETRGMVLGPNPNPAGGVLIKCPWSIQHTSGQDGDFEHRLLARRQVHQTRL